MSRMSRDVRILLEPQNPLDIRPEEMQSLVDEMRTLDRDYDVHIAYYTPPSGAQSTYQVTWWEVLTIWIAAQVGSAAIQQIVQLTVDWMKRRFSEPYRETRPKHIRIVRYEGESGEVIEIIHITHPEKRPDYREPTEEDRRSIARPVPPVQDEEQD